MSEPSPYDWPMIVAKIVIVVCLFYVAFVVAFCPCKTLVACHLPFVYVPLAIVVVLCIFFNGLKAY